MSAPFRIRYPDGLIRPSDVKVKDLSEDNSNDINNYLQRLVKLIPGEAITMHLTIQSMIKAQIDPPESYQYLPFVGLLVVIIVRVFGTRIETEKTKWDIEWLGVFMSVISYIIWIYATGGMFPCFCIREDQSVWIGVIMMLWTFAIPYFYKPKSKP